MESEQILENYDNYTDTYTLNPRIRVFISDITFNKLILPDSLKILDLWGDDDLHQSVTFNIPYSIEQLVLKNINIENIHFLDLCVGKYNLINVSINNINLNILIDELYIKYFNKYPKSEHSDKYLNNKILSKYHHNIIEEILEYEKRITQANAFCKIIKEELLATAFHPERIGPLISKYGIEIMDIF